MKHHKAQIVHTLFLACALWTLTACKHVSQLRPDHPRLALGVRMQDVVFASASLGRQMHYRVFRPENLPAGRNLPDVYLLLGAANDYRTWSNDSDVSEYAANGLILVMPDGDLSYYVNSVEARSEKYEDYVTHDLIADVESRFPVRRDRAGRAVVGVSMGGYAAVYYALKRPELFAYAGGKPR